MVYFGTELSNLYKALNLVEREFSLLRDKKMGILQLSRTKKQLIGQLAIANENREDLMLSLGRSYLYFDKVDSLSTVIEKIEKITSDDIFYVANEMLDQNRLSKLIFQ
jgi:predicted Zn-dependent peptidase